MIITEKQLLMLLQILKDTLVFYERESGDPFSFNLKCRIELLDEIYNQQSDILQEIK